MMERLRALEREVKATSEQIQALSAREGWAGVSFSDSKGTEKSGGDVS
jgi:hypothetical protein